MTDFKGLHAELTRRRDSAMAEMKSKSQSRCAHLDYVTCLLDNATAILLALETAQRLEELQRQLTAANSESREQMKTIERLRSERKKCPHPCDSCKEFESHL